jgi:hypothetical protein
MKPFVDMGSKGLTPMRTRLALAACLAVTALAPLAAHHSFAAEFDDTKPVKMTGVIKKVEWTNPHIWFYLDVKNTDGTVTTWGFAGGAPGQLMRRGIVRSAEARRNGCRRGFSREGRLEQRLRRTRDLP